MSSLALTLRVQGHYSKAAELNEAVLEIKKRLLGEEHPSTLISMNNLASTLYHQGQHTVAP
jgi:hypothetical protein